MQITQRPAGEVTVLDLAPATSGDFSPQLFRGHIENLIEEGHRKLVLNCQQLRWIDSTNLGLLVAAHRSITQSGGRVVMAEPNDRIRELIKVVGMTQIWDIYATEEEAVGSFSARGQA